jgi:hypothetical protein
MLTYCEEQTYNQIIQGCKEIAKDPEVDEKTAKYMVIAPNCCEK